MSDAPVNVIPVEDDEQTLPVVEAPPPAAPVAEAKPPEADAAEVEAVEVAGKKYVPVAAVIAERKGRQAAEQKAARVDELERFFQEKAPYVRVLEENPDLFKRPQAPEPPRPEPKAEDDPDAVEAAQLMDFYTPDGKPDVARGARWLKLQDKRAGRQAQQFIQPIQHESLQQKANANFYRVMDIKDPTGAKPSEQAVRAIWGQILAEPNGIATLANPQAAAFLAMAALGMDRMLTKPQPAVPEKEPVVSEPPGGPSRPAQKPLSALEETIAKQRGISNTKWHEHTKGFVQGRPTVIEED